MPDPTPLREVLPVAMDVPGALRGLADQIENGDYGNIRAVGVVTLRREEADPIEEHKFDGKLETFGFGADGEPGWLSLMFGLALSRLQKGID